MIPTVGTLAGVPPVQTYDTIYFTVYLPSGPKPQGGWPVMITSGAGYRHQGTPSLVATFASRGIATIGIGAEGFGFGPLSITAVQLHRRDLADHRRCGARLRPERQQPDWGRGGMSAVGRSTVDRPGVSDTQKQTVIDLLQLAARNRGGDGRGRRWISRPRCVRGSRSMVSRPAAATARSWRLSTRA